MKTEKSGNYMQTAATANPSRTATVPQRMAAAQVQTAGRRSARSAAKDGMDGPVTRETVRASQGLPRIHLEATVARYENVGKWLGVGVARFFTLRQKTPLDAIMAVTFGVPAILMGAAVGRISHGAARPDVLASHGFYHAGILPRAKSREVARTLRAMGTVSLPGTHFYAEKFDAAPTQMRLAKLGLNPEQIGQVRQYLHLWAEDTQQNR